MLVVAEPELLRNIMVKDFNSFVNRRNFKSNHELLDRGLTTLMDDEWKRIRSVVSRDEKFTEIFKSSEILAKFSLLNISLLFL